MLLTIPVSMRILQRKMESKQLTIGRAGEHLVMYDLLSHGYKCFLTDQGLNYDVVIDIGRRMLRLQVKTTQKPGCISHTYKTSTYLFHVRRAGKGGKRFYAVDEFDGFALVTMDTRSVYYYPFHEQITRTLILRDGRQRGKYKTNYGKIAPYIEGFTLEKFLSDFK